MRLIVFTYNTKSVWTIHTMENCFFFSFVYPVFAISDNMWTIISIKRVVLFGACLFFSCLQDKDIGATPTRTTDYFVSGMCIFLSISSNFLTDAICVSFSAVTLFHLRQHRTHRVNSESYIENHMHELFEFCTALVQAILKMYNSKITFCARFLSFRFNWSPSKRENYTHVSKIKRTINRCWKMLP